MSRRLLGLETEFAFTFRPERGGQRPSCKQMYEAMAAVLSREVQVAKGDGSRLFTEAGASVSFESPTRGDNGLLETGTPECTDPGQLLLYQRALESLLLRCRPLAEKALAEQGY